LLADEAFPGPAGVFGSAGDGDFGAKFGVGVDVHDAGDALGILAEVDAGVAAEIDGAPGSAGGVDEASLQIGVERIAVIGTNGGEVFAVGVPFGGVGVEAISGGELGVSDGVEFGFGFAPE